MFNEPMKANRRFFKNVSHKLVDMHASASYSHLNDQVSLFVRDEMGNTLLVQLSGDQVEDLGKFVTRCREEKRKELEAKGLTGIPKPV